MSSSTGQKYEWLVILPDHDGTLSKRMEVRPSHLEKVMPLHENGFWQVGGALFSEPPKDGEMPIIGSAMIALAETKEEVVDAIKKDIYYTSGVWDLSKMQIWPFRSAIRKGLKGGA